MKQFKFLFVYVMVVFVGLSCSSDDSSSSDTDTENLNPTKAFEALNVSYGDDTDQVFDIYLPANRSSDTKLIVLVHGGGWTSGDKTDMNPFVTLLLQELPEYGIVNINYRLANETNQPYPMQINDITTIINTLKVEQEYYIFSEDFGFIGASAGAHLSMLWSYAFDEDDDIKMVCSIVGPTNFTDPAYLNNTDGNLQELLNLYGVNPTITFLEEVSPYHRVGIGAAPTILFYGGQDPLIPTSQGTDMQAKLAELGVTHEFTLYENEGHGWTGANLFDTWSKLKVFIEEQL